MCVDADHQTNGIFIARHALASQPEAATGYYLPEKKKGQMVIYSCMAVIKKRNCL